MGGGGTCQKHCYPERKHYIGPIPHTCLNGKSLQCCSSWAWEHKGRKGAVYATGQMSDLQKSRLRSEPFPLSGAALHWDALFLGLMGGDQGKERLGVSALAIACPAIPSWRCELGLKRVSGRQMGSMSAAVCCLGQSLLLPKVCCLFPWLDCCVLIGKWA